MPDQERLHWTAVLQQNPQHELARKRLKLVEYHGMLLTREEIEEYNQFVKWQESKQREWTPRVKNWRSALTGSDEQLRQKAEEELQQVDDFGAIPFLEQILAPVNESAGTKVVSVLARFEQQVATDSLIRLAVLSPFPEVRGAATEQLDTRSLYSYVPTLLGGLSNPIEFSYFVDTATDNAFYGYKVVQEGPDAVLVHSFTRHYGYSPFSQVEWKERARDVQLGANQGIVDGKKLQNRVARANAQAEALNQRIYEVLEHATRQEQLQLEREPQQWWQWWQDYNGFQRSDQKPIVRQSGNQEVNLATRHECFLPGTLVWTDTGTLPIESVRIGDRVLAQDPETGEVTYKLVINTTVREPSPTLRVGLGDEEIVATDGHPMWVVGKGWRMTKQLNAGDRLHTAQGSQKIEFVEPGPESQAHNLVVADFHTYMVGKNRVLVHDNILRRSTKNVVPGLAE